MNQSEIEVLSRAHDMFAGGTRHPALDAGTGHYRNMLRRAAGLNDGLAHGGYRLAVDHSRQRLAAAAATDAAAADVIASAHRDRAQARDLTRSVLDEARADATVVPATPMAQREAMRRRAARLRAQRAHVLSARFRARRHLAELRALRYQLPAPPRRRTGVERARRDRGARRVVAPGPTLCVGRDGARPVRLFGPGPVELCASGNSLGPHHLSADQRRDPGAPLASPAR